MKSFLKLKILFVFAALFPFIAATSAQYGSIKGKIFDSKTNEPLIGASVKVTGTSTGSATDFDGNYTISNLKQGNYSISVSYISYKPQIKENVVVEAGKETTIDVLLELADIALKEVQVVAKANRASENILLMEQKNAVIATQAVGAREMSRKGIGNAEAAVAQVSGISKQEGVRNVFVRGLGDRYNATMLNGYPIPSEDPEYKNISLEFFGKDIIQNIGVNKVFAGNHYGDAGGAIIDVYSKELTGKKELNVDISAGFNSKTIGSDFLQTDGVNYLGISRDVQPGKSYKALYNYGNRLDPHAVKLPLNYSYGFSGGKRFAMGENRNPLSFYVVANYSTGYSFTQEKIYDTTSDGTLIQNLDGNKSSQNINQLLLGSVNFEIARKHQINYNFMLIHDNRQYVGNYIGQAPKFEAGQAEEYQYSGFVRRQQSNDNLLIVNQIISKFTFAKNYQIDAGISYNRVKGAEPDRRVNKLFQKNATEYSLLPGDGAHIRNYEKLIENDLNGKFGLTYHLPKKFKDDISAVKIGYDGRYITDNFRATEYATKAIGFSDVQTLDNLNLDKWLNQPNYDNKNHFSGDARISMYTVNKFINSVYALFTYRFTPRFTAGAGVRADAVNLKIDYNVQGGYNGNGMQQLNPFFILPSLNLKYDINDKNSLRLGLSKTYTLPQSKEISPYQYLGLTFSSQGNQNLKPSDNYNADLKWDYYLSPSEIISVTTFFKHIKNPIARAYEANGAGYFTYDNISKYANVAGVETEIRKNIFDASSSEQEKVNRLTAGLNASYIYSDMKTDIRGSAAKKSQLEGAAPFIVNADVSYNYACKNFSLINSLVINYFSKRIYTIGLGGYEDVMEKGIPTLNFISTSQLNKHVEIKLKAKNLLDPTFELTRKASLSGENKILNSYKKGIDLSLGITYIF